MKKILTLSFFYFLTFFVGLPWAAAQTPIEISDEETLFHTTDKNLHFLLDAEGKLSFEQAEKTSFVPFAEHSEVGSAEAYWLKFSVKNALPQDDFFVLYLGLANNVQLYWRKPNGAIEKQQLGGLFPLPREEQAGPGKSLADKWQVRLKSGQTQTFYVKFERMNVDFPARDIEVTPIISLTRRLERETSWNDRLRALAIGGILMIFFYNLFYFFISRDRAYLFYCSYILIAAGQVAVFNFPIFELRQDQAVAVILFMGLTLMFYFLFMRQVLNTASRMPKWDKFLVRWLWFRGIITVFSVAWVSSGFDFQLMDVIQITTFSLEFVLLIVFSVKLFLQKDLMPKLFVVGSFFPWFGLVLLASTTERIAFIVGVQAQTFEFSIAAELILFSMVLGYRARLNEKAKRAAQQKLIGQLEENKKLQTKVNRELEDKVRERTHELTEMNEEMKQINEELLTTTETLREQQEALSEKNREISVAHSEIKESINYSKRIQEAVLPDQQKLDELFGSAENYFVLFKPRDIVSGDFYWGDRNAEGRIFFVTSDCTGHGVPGAMMSMLGSQALSEIILHRHIYDAGKILDELHELIYEALRKRTSGARDGMDISLISYKAGEENLYFASAKQTLFVIDEAQEASSVKGDRQAIGELKTRKKHTGYRSQAVPVAGNTFYMSSDGYPDQFGGPEKRKFLSKRFKGLLCSIVHQPFQTQAQVLDETIEAWRKEGNEAQIDDILVAGFRF